MTAKRDRGDRRRRQFLAGAAGAVAMATAGLVGPVTLAATPRRPAQRMRVFSDHQAATYAAWCDVLAIGAAGAGVADFVDQQLARPHRDCLLLLRTLSNPPLTDFYLQGIAGIDAESRARFAQPFLGLGADDRQAVVKAAATSSTRAWTAPDPAFFYFISRSDAVDVVYGTMEGFRELDVPYLPHIHPQRPW